MRWSNIQQLRASERKKSSPSESGSESIQIEQISLQDKNEINILICNDGNLQSYHT